MFFRNTLKKVHGVVDKGSKDIQNLVAKAEGFVEQAEEVIKSSDNGIKIMVGFVVVAMGAQTINSLIQLRINMKMLKYMKGMGK